MNLAAVFKLPALLLCRNNGWAISVPRSGQTATPTFAQKAIAYGMPGVLVDGNDILAMIHVVAEAAARGRRGDGPTLIEALTYRRGAHSSSDDPSVYRDPAEPKEWESRDPLDRLTQVHAGPGRAAGRAGADAARGDQRSRSTTPSPTPRAARPNRRSPACSRTSMPMSPGTCASSARSWKPRSPPTVPRPPRTGAETGARRAGQSASCCLTNCTSVALPTAMVTELGTFTTRHCMVHGKLPDAAMFVYGP